MSSSTRVDSDSPWKELFQQALELVFAFFFPDIHADLDWGRDCESLEQELRQLAPMAEVGKRIADVLVKAYQRGTGDPRYFHVEAQGQPEDEFPHRVHVYQYRAEDRFAQHVVSLTILTDEDPEWRPNQYRAEQYGCVRTLTWPVRKLTDWVGREAELIAHPNPVGLFVLAQLEAQRTRGDVEARAAAKLRLISLVHQRKMEAEQVRQWYRYFDWFLPLPPEQEAGGVCGARSSVRRRVA